MGKQLSECISYRGDRLFDGAVNVSWLNQDPEKARAVAEAYVFHGPEYHGVSQQDVGTGHGHRLVDTASFALQVIRRCNGSENKPLTLAIAGYGTGKSHLATALSILLSDPESDHARNILKNIESADPEIYNAVCHEMADVEKPALVVTLNGIGNFDLAAEFSRQIMNNLNAAKIDSGALDALRPRFKTASNLAARLTSKEGEELAGECGFTSITEVISRLNEHDETIYGIAHSYLSRLGFSIKALGDETVKDVIDTVCREYVGEGQPYNRLVVLFDEFGRYAEFATVRSQIAGSGVLQQLFEGIQANADRSTFIGFIQFDLNTYVQRMGQEYRNEILRVSTRYQSAEKAHLSINLETLLANLLEKKDYPSLKEYFDSENEKSASENIMTQLNQWYPQSAKHRLWAECPDFHRIIRKGCWPLSPYATWLLFHLAAAGQHLQQRSALFLLGEAFNYHHSETISGFDWQLQATDIWSEALETELLTAEEGGNRGSIAHAYSNVMAKVGQHISKREQTLLRSIVLASKMGLVSRDRMDASKALASLSGLTMPVVTNSLNTLENERNVLSWDDSFKQFEIIGDTVTRPQFLAFLRQKVSEKYDGYAKSQLFLRSAQQYCPDILCDRDCDFAERHNISTIEWRFASVITNLSELPRVLYEAVKYWGESRAIDHPRGTIVYCYVEPENDPAQIQTQASSLLKNIIQGEGQEALPIIIIFLFDEDGTVGQCLAELNVLAEDVSEQDRTRFGNLVNAHRQKCQDLLSGRMEDLIREKSGVSCAPVDPSDGPLRNICSEIFEVVYPKVLPFPFDGYSTSRGNAADTCHNLTLELMRGHLTYNDVMTKAVRDKNRATEVLNKCWQIFLKNGDVSQRPNQDSVRAVFSAWEDALRSQGGLISMAEMIHLACNPPFGANIASAGLLLGTYLCARQKVFAICCGDSQLELSDLSGDLLFRGKHLDFAKLQELKIIPKKEDEGSEWDTFLDEWEAAAERSYKEQIDYLERSVSLRTRIPLPKSQTYRLNFLEMKGIEAKRKLAALDNKISKAYERIEFSEKRFDLHGITFSAVKIKEAIEQIKGDEMFPQNDVERYQEQIVLICQRTIQIFDSWLLRQGPRGRTIKDASDFERYMRETSLNLKKLGLDETADKAERHLAKAMHHINTLAEAQALTENIETWLTSIIADRAPRIVDLRNQRDIATEYLKKTSELLKTVQAPGLDAARNRLKKFITFNKQREDELMSRFGALLDSKFSLDSVDEYIEAVDDIEKIFDRCESDVRELRIMRKALYFYKNASIRLCDENLTEDAFSILKEELTDMADEISEDEPPWMPDEVMPILYEDALRKREILGFRWLKDMENEVSDMQGMDISNATNIHSRLQQVPAYLTKDQKKEAEKLSLKIERYLNTLKVEWLLEKYRELSNDSKIAFLKAIGMEKDQADLASEVNSVRKIRKIIR